MSQVNSSICSVNLLHLRRATDKCFFYITTISKIHWRTILFIKGISETKLRTFSSSKALKISIFTKFNKSFCSDICFINFCYLTTYKTWNFMDIFSIFYNSCNNSVISLQSNLLLSRCFPWNEVTVYQKGLSSVD